MLLNIKLLNKMKYVGNRTRTLDLYRFLRKEYRHFNHKKRYKRISNNSIEYPSRFIFELTKKCNLNCDMCFQKSIKSARELTLEEIDKVLHNLGPHCRYIYLIGGEIFLREDLFDILELLKNKYKKDCFLTTNGTLINDDITSRLSRYTNINGILMSLDGPRNIHNQLRDSEDAFDKTVNAIRLLKDKFRVSVNCILLKENIRHLPEVVRIVHESGIYNIQFLFQVIADKASMDATKKILDMGEFEIAVKEKTSNSYGFSYELFQSKIREAKRLGGRLGVKVIVTPNLPESYLNEYFHNTLFRHRKTACKALLHERINFNGDVIHCAYLKMNFGNLLNSSFEEIWNSDKMRLFRKKSLQNNILPICKRCLVR